MRTPLAKQEAAAGFMDSPFLLHQRGLCNVGTPPNRASPEPEEELTAAEKMGAAIPEDPSTVAWGGQAQLPQP